MRDQGQREVQHMCNLWSANALLLKIFWGGYCRGANTKYKYFLNYYLGGAKAERNEKLSRDMVDSNPPILLTNFFLWR